MKLYTPIIFLVLCALACQAPVDNSAKEAFDKNSKAVMAYIDGFQAEKMDYSIFADDFVQLSTSFNAPQDSVNLDALKERYAAFWKANDFTLVTDPVQLLPGVNQDTGEADGSVRYYGEWKGTNSETSHSANLQIYQSFDFNEEGKIAVMMAYADWTAFFNALATPPAEEAAAEE